MFCSRRPSAGGFGPFATYEIPYGTIERPTTRDNSWEKAQFEVAAMRWADLSGPGGDGKQHGLSILNNSKYAYDAAGNVLRLTLLRSPKWPDPMPTWAIITSTTRSIRMRVLGRMR